MGLPVLTTMAAEGKYERALVMGAAALAVSLLLQGCGGGGGVSPSPSPGPSPHPSPASAIEGFYTDSKYRSNSAASLAGTRMISQRVGDNLTDKLTVVGTSDGASFWTMRGEWISKTNGEFSVDFSPLGGLTDLVGKLSSGGIKWADGSTWTLAAKPPAHAAATKAVEDVGGFYADPNHAKDDSFAGYRFISDIADMMPSNNITLVGSDDGCTFWSLKGAFTNKSTGALVVDFSPKGGPADLQGTFTGTNITWKDGNAWTMHVAHATSFLLS